MYEQEWSGKKKEVGVKDFGCRYLYYMERVAFASNSALNGFRTLLC